MIDQGVGHTTNLIHDHYAKMLYQADPISQWFSLMIIMSWPLIRTEEEARAIHDDGMAFLRGNIQLAQISVRLFGECHIYVFPKLKFYINCMYTAPFSKTADARRGLKEWYVRPKLHASCMHSSIADLSAPTLEPPITHKTINALQLMHCVYNEALLF